jgi:hypothetical protein
MKRENNKKGSKLNELSKVLDEKIRSTGNSENLSHAFAARLFKNQ